MFIRPFSVFMFTNPVWLGIAKTTLDKIGGTWSHLHRKWQYVTICDKQWLKFRVFRLKDQFLDFELFVDNYSLKNCHSKLISQSILALTIWGRPDLHIDVLACLFSGFRAEILIKNWSKYYKYLQEDNISFNLHDIPEADKTCCIVCSVIQGEWFALVEF